MKNWQRITTAKSISTENLRRFDSGTHNIAIALGEQAGGLCCIDWDTEDAYMHFLELNPRLERTLVSQGRRGANFWIRIEGEYPRSRALYLPAIKEGRWERQKVGEWRSTGNCQVIHGMHESGIPYSCNWKEPLEVRFEDISWPVGLAPFNKEIEDESVSIENHMTLVRGVSFSVKSLEHAVSLSTPQQTHCSDERMFVFCRAIKSLEFQRGSEFTPSELESAFDLWYKAALPFLRKTQSRTKYFREFMHRYKRAEKPLGLNELVERAVERTKSTPPPGDSLRFSDEPVLSKLVHILHSLQVESGNNPFYLPTRTAGWILDISHVKAGEWLRFLIDLGIIQVVKPGSRKLSPHLLYPGAIETQM